MSSGDGIGLRRDADGFLSTRGIPEARRPWESMPRTYTPARRCACGTRLSIYNPDNHCAACETDPWADH